MSKTYAPIDEPQDGALLRASLAVSSAPATAFSTPSQPLRAGWQRRWRSLELTTALVEGHAAVNPVSQLVDRPRIQRDEVEWLEPEEAARFLYECTGDPHTLMAIALLTSTRRSEATGLEWEDVDFERGLIRVRPNRWRKLKRPHSARSVRPWPQLRETLEPLQQESGLVVPNCNGKPYTDLRRGMEAAAERAKITKLTSWNTLRHTYASLRLQSLENGAAVSPFQVVKELGHKG